MTKKDDGLCRIGTVKEIILGVAFNDTLAQDLIFQAVREKNINRNDSGIKIKLATYKVGIVDFDMITQQ